jgi:uncharacterized membrane protein YhaH (DUF805 family)
MDRLRKYHTTILLQRFVESVRATVTSTFRFAGRSPRTEVFAYWIAASVLGMLPFMALTTGRLYKESALSVLILSAILLIPFPALLVRRLHDQNRTGWWALVWAPTLTTSILMGAEPPGIALGLLAGLGNLLLVGFLLWPGSEGENRYGRNPRAALNDR